MTLLTNADWAQYLFLHHRLFGWYSPQQRFA